MTNSLFEYTQNLSRKLSMREGGFYVLPTTVGLSNHDITRTRSPAYSFGHRFRTGVCEGPGPDTYNISCLTRHGRPGAPSYILGPRLKHGGWYPKKGESPGPGAYSPELYGSIQAKCTMSRRVVLDSTLPSQHSLPASRTRTKPQRELSTPGPGAYDVTPLEAYKTRSPGVRLAPSWPLNQRH